MTRAGGAAGVAAFIRSVRSHLCPSLNLGGKARLRRGECCASPRIASLRARHGNDNKRCGAASTAGRISKALLILLTLILECDNCRTAIGRAISTDQNKKD